MHNDIQLFEKKKKKFQRWNRTQETREVREDFLFIPVTQISFLK